MYKSVFRNFRLLDVNTFNDYLSFCREFIEYRCISSRILERNLIGTWNITDLSLNINLNKKIDRNDISVLISSIVSFMLTINPKDFLIKIGYSEYEYQFIMKDEKKE